MTLSLLAAAATLAAPGELKLFQDWIVGCDNGRACHATSLLAEDDDWDRPVKMAIMRGPEPDAVPEVVIFGTEGAAAAIAADGKRLAAKIVRGESDDEVDPGSSREVVAALRRARSVTILDRQGKEIGRVSPAGVSAALLYMDDAQKRVGTVTALIRHGPKPASAVPPPPPLPTVRSAVRPAPNPVRVSDDEIATLRAEHDCDDRQDWTDRDSQEPLDPDHSLILVGCWMGAYNSSEIPLIATRSGNGVRIEIAKFDVDFHQDGQVPMLVNAGWAPNEGLLTSFAKGRGIGDCGEGSDYAWDGERFRLVQRIEMGECRGSTDYITTWRARLVKP